MGQPVVHWELWSKDPQKVADFYAKAFDWNISHLAEMKYWLVDTGGEGGINGGIFKPQEGKWPGNAKDPEGRTPLMFAISWGGNDMVQLLIDRGADLFIKDQQGWDAHRLARSRGYRDLMDLLLKAMYPPDSTEKES